MHHDLRRLGAIGNAPSGGGKGGLMLIIGWVRDRHLAGGEQTGQGRDRRGCARGGNHMRGVWNRPKFACGRDQAIIRGYTG